MRLPNLERQLSETVLKIGLMTVFIHEKTVPMITAINVSLKPWLRNKKGVAELKVDPSIRMAIAPQSTQKKSVQI